MAWSRHRRTRNPTICAAFPLLPAGNEQATSRVVRRNTPGSRLTPPEHSITLVRKPPRTRRRVFRRLSSARHPQNAEEETRKDGLKPQREAHESRNHDAQRFFRVQRAKIMGPPVSETQHPRAGSSEYEQDSNNEPDFEGDISKEQSKTR